MSAINSPGKCLGNARGKLSEEFLEKYPAKCLDYMQDYV